MTKDEKWIICTSLDKEEEDEALSLSDLPVNEGDNEIENNSKPKEVLKHQVKEVKEEFNFNSFGSSALAETEMCAADEIFFQGRILPFRHSVSFETGLVMFGEVDGGSSISRSQSMDHRYSSAANFISASSTRSSSIRSGHNSRSSSTGSSSSAATKPPRPRSRNQFHSHPSPNPQIRIQSGSWSHYRSQKSALWALFQVGLVRPPPENTRLAHLKIHKMNVLNSKNFGSHNSTSSGTSSTSASTSSNGKKMKDTCSSEKKRKQQSYWPKLFDRNGAALFGRSCRCSVDQTVHPKVISKINSSDSSSSSNSFKFGKELGTKGEAVKKKKTTREKGKQAMSRHRTFEWLKQLSLEDGPKRQQLS